MVFDFETYVREALGRHDAKLDRIEDRVTNLRIKVAVTSATVAGIISIAAALLR